MTRSLENTGTSSTPVFIRQGTDLVRERSWSGLLIMLFAILNVPPALLVAFLTLASAGANSLFMATWFLPPVFHTPGLYTLVAFSANTTGRGTLPVSTVVTLLPGVFLLSLRRVRQMMFGLYLFLMRGTVLWSTLLLPHSDVVVLWNAGQGSGAYQNVLAVSSTSGYRLLPTVVFLNTFSAIISCFQNSGYFSGEIRAATSWTHKVTLATRHGSGSDVISRSTRRLHIVRAIEEIPLEQAGMHR